MPPDGFEQAATHRITAHNIAGRAKPAPAILFNWFIHFSFIT
jgi:hypothetical protein